jgi:hypothetical protein
VSLPFASSIHPKIMCLSLIVIWISLLLLNAIPNVSGSEILRRQSQILYEESLRVNQQTDRLQHQLERPITSTSSYRRSSIAAQRIIDFNKESQNQVATLRLGADNITNSRVKVTEEEADKAQVERGLHVTKITKITKDLLKVWDYTNESINRSFEVERNLRSQKKASRLFAQAVIAATWEKHKRQLEKWHIETQLAYDEAIAFFSNKTLSMPLDLEPMGGSMAGATPPPLAQQTLAILSSQSTTTSRPALSKRGSPITVPSNLISPVPGLILPTSNPVRSSPPNPDLAKQQQQLSSLTTSSSPSSVSNGPLPKPDWEPVCNYTNIFPYDDVFSCWEGLKGMITSIFKTSTIGKDVLFCSSGKAQIAGSSYGRENKLSTGNQISYALYEIMFACRKVDNRTGGTLHFYGGMIFALLKAHS